MAAAKKTQLTMLKLRKTTVSGSATPTLIAPSAIEQISVHEGRAIIKLKEQSYPVWCVETFDEIQAKLEELGVVIMPADYYSN